MKAPFFRTGYNYDRDEASRESGLTCPEETLTVQSERDDADINVLVKRFGLLGVMPESPRVPMYGDFTEINDYRSALEIVRLADSAFMELTPEVRSRFENDPQKLMEFVSDDANIEEARKLGLLRKDDPVPLPIKVEVVAGAVPAPSAPPKE